MTTINTFFKEDIKIPSPPPIAAKIIEAVRQEHESFNDLDKIIISDPALVAKIW